MTEVFTRRCNPHAKRFSWFGCARHRGGMGGGPPTVQAPLVGGQQYLRSDDNTWHLVCLELEDGVNNTRVIQTNAPSPGAQYLGYVVMHTPDDGSKHKISLVKYDGVHSLYVDQSTIVAPSYISRSLKSSNTIYYLVRLVLEDGTYALWIEAP